MTSSGLNAEPVGFGRQLLADVETYSSRTSHRTGTSDDAETLEWFASILRSDGAAVRVDPWSFPRWAAEWSAELYGEVVDSLPVFYETVGSFDPEAIDIVATEHPGGLLAVRNRRAIANPPTMARATLQIPGRFAGHSNEVRAHIKDARMVEGRSANIVASYGGDFEESSILVATPLSGWFSCASERGTGISVARWLSHALAQRGHQVGLLGTSGHELFNIGLERHLATHTIPDSVKTIVHVGASVAARSLLEPDQLSESVYVTSNVKGTGTKLESLGFHHRVGGADPKGWIGEGTRWCLEGRPLLSVAGMSHWFHTPQDTDDRTTAELLERVAGALLVDCLALIEPV